MIVCSVVYIEVLLKTKLNLFKEFAICFINELKDEKIRMTEWDVYIKHAWFTQPANWENLHKWWQTVIIYAWTGRQ